MNEVGVRELKTKLSSLLHRVEEGEQIRVTVRGRPVADIVPAGSRPANDRMRELVASGKVTPAARPHPRRNPRPAAGTRSASALVLGEREDGR